MMKRESGLGVLLCLGSLLVTGRLAMAQEARASLFELHTADGRTVTGPLEQVQDDWSVSLGGTSPSTAKGSEVISLRRSMAALPGFPREEHVILANGDRIPGTLIKITGERLRMQALVGSRQELDLPLAAVTLVWFSTPNSVDDAAALL